jgi:hypothetical protein
MKKIIYFAVAMFFGLAMVSCVDGKSGGESGAAGTEAAAGVEDETEAAVKAYEEYFVKYEALMKKSEAGEDILDSLMELQEDVLPISEALIKTEGKRNDDQKARVKAIEEKLDAYKKKIMGQ